MNIDYQFIEKWVTGKIYYKDHKYNNLYTLAAIGFMIGKPLKITSSLRSEEENKNCGGSPTSSHLKGLAFDIAIESSQHRFELIKYAMLLKVKRIGVYKTFIHIDFDDEKVQSVVWYE